MLKNLLCISTMLLTLAASGQQRDKDFYQGRAKKQKTIGWMLLGGGAVTFIVGGSQWSFAGYDESDADKQKVGSVLIFTGLAAAISSIPVFAAAKRNKKKAISVALEKQYILVLQTGRYISRYTPSINIKLRL